MKWLIVCVALIHMSLMWAPGVVGAQIINSDPEFKREGKKPYTCKTPKGSKVKCNQWEFQNLTGWKKVCGLKKNQSPLKKLANPEAHKVNLRTPDKGCAALYDREWADYRRWEDLAGEEWEAWEAEAARELKPAAFHQKVEIKKAGTYELRACMVAHMAKWKNFGSVKAGLSVRLEQWHKETIGMPTVHAEIPEKVTWGNHEHVPMLEHDVFPAGNRGDLLWAGDIYFYAHDGIQWGYMDDYLDYWRTCLPPIDGHDGHAGLRMAYQTTLPMTTEAIWTCHAKTVELGTGFYLIIAEANPLWDDDDDFVYYDYDGFGSIRSIHLRKVGAN
jgi:hypothetical protein